MDGKPEQQPEANEGPMVPMDIAWMIDVPGLTDQQYHGLRRELRMEVMVPNGRLVHVAGPVAGGWRLVEVWSSRPAMEAFHRDRLLPGLIAVGVHVVEAEARTWSVGCLDR